MAEGWAIGESRTLLQPLLFWSLFSSVFRLIDVSPCLLILALPLVTCNPLVSRESLVVPIKL